MTVTGSAGSPAVVRQGKVWSTQEYSQQVRTAEARTYLSAQERDQNTGWNGNPGPWMEGEGPCWDWPGHVVHSGWWQYDCIVVYCIVLFHTKDTAMAKKTLKSRRITLLTVICMIFHFNLNARLRCLKPILHQQLCCEVQKGKIFLSYDLHFVENWVWKK